MQQDKINQPAAIKTGNIIFGMILMFIIVHIGFHATYIKEFPVFQKYNWLHHIHGALMGSWVMLLLVRNTSFFGQAELCSCTLYDCVNGIYSQA